MRVFLLSLSFFDCGGGGAPPHLSRKENFKIIEFKESEMIDQEMDRVHVDDGWLIYMPDVPGDTPVSPYWMQFIGIAKMSESILWKDGDPETHQFILFNENMEIVAVNIKEPVNDDSAPVEDVIQFAKEYLDEETVHDLVEYCMSMRNTFNLNNEMSEQDFMQIIASDMCDGEKHKALEGYDNVFYIGDGDQ
tara:strand:- start:1363 stop:1938 length:576 start_codon:yes stop_codon:yes gene_type:complete